MLSNEEIDQQTLSTTDGVSPLKKIYDCVSTDGDVLTDGEVIDMIMNYLQELGVHGYE